MPQKRTFSDEQIQKLTLPPANDPRGFVISDIAAAKPSAIYRESTTSSLGYLGHLPAELLLLVLDGLDFQSLSRLSCTCLRTKTVVENLPAYKDMITYAPEALTALGMTRLLEHHPAPRLLRALRDDKCVSCLGLGWFLFLPTCERVCYRCLSYNWGLRMVEQGVARECFHLSPRQLASIPVMHTLPGTGGRVEKHCRRGLICVREAKRLAIETYGSVEKAASQIPRVPVPADQLPQQESQILTRFREAPLEPTGYKMPMSISLAFQGHKYDEASAVRLPRLTDSGLDNGRLCMGCDVMLRHHRRPYGVSPRIIFWSRVRRAATMGNLQSREGFLRHIQTCQGVGELLAEWAES